MRLVLLLAAVLAFGSACSLLEDAATGALKGAAGVDSGLSVETEIKNADGDVNEETVVGSKTETHQNVTAEKVDELVAEKQEAQTIINERVPSWAIWLIIGLSISNLLFWSLDSPGTLWDKYVKWRKS